MLALVLALNVSAPPAQQFVVENKCTQTFTVVNKTFPIRSVKKTMSVGCGCSTGNTCGAGFCKANGGSGCPVSCPVKGLESAIVSDPSPTLTLPQYSNYGVSGNNCAGGNCSTSSSRGVGMWYPGKNLRR